VTVTELLASPQGLAIVFLGLAAVNLATFVALARDKAQARAGGWRVAEYTLLWLALLGGWPAAKLAQRRLRHKTRKEPFRTLLNFVPLAWVAAALALCWA
jgi:uncharacterized membrane protein YsdA (DUF1294 family)